MNGVNADSSMGYRRSSAFIGGLEDFLGEHQILDHGHPRQSPTSAGSKQIWPPMNGMNADLSVVIGVHLRLSAAYRIFWANVNYPITAILGGARNADTGRE